MAKNPFKRGSNKWMMFDEIRKLKNRAKTWERKYHISYTNIPTMPERVTKKDIARVKSITYRNLTEQELKVASKEYTYRYENGLLPKQYTPSTQFVPNTERQWEQGQENPQPEQPDDGNESPAVSETEIDAWIQNIFDDILDMSQIDKPNMEVRAILEGLLEAAMNRMGKQAFYEWLENGETQEQLKRQAYPAIAVSPPKPGELVPRYQTYVEQFATILNQGKPLSMEQSMTLSQEGYVNFDYSD